MKAALAIVCLLPIVAESEILFVDYEGTVTSVSHSPGYAIGDAVSGRLTIDTLLAPPETETRRRTKPTMESSRGM